MFPCIEPKEFQLKDTGAIAESPCRKKKSGMQSIKENQEAGKAQRGQMPKYLVLNLFTLFF